MTEIAQSVQACNFTQFVSRAEGVVVTCQRLQAAYKEKSTALADLRAEQAAQLDELDEAETRARHLRMQLEDISTRASDQERWLKVELQAEQQKRQEVEARWRSVVEEPPSCPGQVDYCLCALCRHGLGIRHEHAEAGFRAESIYLFVTLKT